MYQHIIPTRILFSVGIGLLIFSLVFGWVAFSVPDWLQFYEHNNLNNQTINDLKKFGLWYKCIFLIDVNDFTCTLWNQDTPSFVRVVQVLIPIGLSFSCLSFLTACFAFICRRAFITTALFAGLFAFLSFVFIIIGLTVFALESLVYVDRLRLDNNEYPRRWGMWLLIPNLILSFLTSICFFLASILNWCDQRNMKVTGILSHSAEKYDGSVCKLPSENNITTAVKKSYPYQDYSTACYQLNGLNNNHNNNQQQNLLGGYPPPPPPSYPDQGYQPTPPGLFGYSRTTSPTINRMYPYSNFDSHHPRHYMSDNSEMDDLPRTTRSRHRSRSRSYSRRRSNRRSRSYSSDESTPTIDNNNNPKQTQFVPISIPYYQPQVQPKSINATNTNSQPISYIIPQEKPQTTIKPTNIIKYSTGQPSVVVPNSTQPIYTIAYRTNNGGNVLAPNLITGPAATTYVTATRNQIAEINTLNNDSDNEDKSYQKLKKININEAWAWRKMH